jgi:hypothetical protein
MSTKSYVFAAIAVAGLVASTLASSTPADAGFRHGGGFRPHGGFARHVFRPSRHVFIRPRHHHVGPIFVQRPIYVRPAPVLRTVYAPAPAPVVQQVAAPAPNCLEKQYTQDGQVLFIDKCTNESAVAPVAQAQPPQQ